LNDGLSDLYLRTAGFTKPKPLREGSSSLARRHRCAQAAGEDLSAPVERRFQRRILSFATGNVLDLAIAEFEKIVALQPKSVEDRMVLGQLYTVKHDEKKAEEEFKTAQAIEPDSEEVVLNLARLYGESGDLAHAAKVIEAVPVSDRSPKMEFALAQPMTS